MLFNKYYMTAKPGKGETIFASSEHKNNSSVNSLCRPVESGYEPSYQLVYCDSLKCFLYLRVNALREGYDSRGSKFVYILQPVEQASPAQYLAPEFTDGSGEDLFRSEVSELSREEFGCPRISVLENEGDLFSLSKEDLAKLIYTLFFNVSAAYAKVVVECDSDLGVKKSIAAFLHELVPEYFRRSLSVNMSDTFFSSASKINIISSGVEYTREKSTFVMDFSDGKLTVKSELPESTEILSCLSRYFADRAYSSLSEYKINVDNFAKLVLAVRKDNLQPLTPFIAAAGLFIKKDGISPALSGCDLLKVFGDVWADLNNAGVNNAWVNNEDVFNKVVYAAADRSFTSKSWSEINKFASVLSKLSVPTGCRSGAALCAAVFDRYYSEGICPETVSGVFNNIKAMDAGFAFKLLKCLRFPAIYKECSDDMTAENLAAMCSDPCDVYILSLQGFDWLADKIFAFAANGEITDYEILEKGFKNLGEEKFRELLDALRAKVVSSLQSLPKEAFVDLFALYEFALKTGDPKIIPTVPADIRAKYLYHLWLSDTVPDKEIYWGEFLECFDKAAPSNHSTLQSFFVQIEKDDEKEGNGRAAVIMAALSAPEKIIPLPKQMTVSLFCDWISDSVKSLVISKTPAENFVECFFNGVEDIGDANFEMCFPVFCKNNKEWAVSFAESIVSEYIKKLEILHSYRTDAMSQESFTAARALAQNLVKCAPLLDFAFKTGQRVQNSYGTNSGGVIVNYLIAINSFVLRETEKVKIGDVLKKTLEIKFEPNYTAGKKVTTATLHAIGAELTAKMQYKKKRTEDVYMEVVKNHINENADSQYIYETLKYTAHYLGSNDTYVDSVETEMRIAYMIMFLFDCKKTDGKYINLVYNLLDSAKSEMTAYGQIKSYNNMLAIVCDRVIDNIFIPDEELEAFIENIKCYNSSLYSVLCKSLQQKKSGSANRSSAQHSSAGFSIDPAYTAPGSARRPTPQPARQTPPQYAQRTPQPAQQVPPQSVQQTPPQSVQSLQEQQNQFYLQPNQQPSEFGQTEKYASQQTPQQNQFPQQTAEIGQSSFDGLSHDEPFSSPDVFAFSAPASAGSPKTGYTTDMSSLGPEFAEDVLGQKIAASAAYSDESAASALPAGKTGIGTARSSYDGNENEIPESDTLGVYGDSYIGGNTEPQSVQELTETPAEPEGDGDGGFGELQAKDNPADNQHENDGQSDKEDKIPFFQRITRNLDFSKLVKNVIYGVVRAALIAVSAMLVVEQKRVLGALLMMFALSVVTGVITLTGLSEKCKKFYEKIKFISPETAKAGFLTYGAVFASYLFTAAWRTDDIFKAITVVFKSFFH